MQFGLKAKYRTCVIAVLTYIRGIVTLVSPLGPSYRGKDPPNLTSRESGKCPAISGLKDLCRQILHGLYPGVLRQAVALFFQAVGNPTGPSDLAPKTHPYIIEPHKKSRTWNQPWIGECTIWANLGLASSQFWHISEVSTVFPHRVPAGRRGRG